MDPTKEMIDVTLRMPLTVWARMKLESERTSSSPGDWLVSQVTRADRLAARLAAEYAQQAHMASLAARTHEIFREWKDFLTNFE